MAVKTDDVHPNTASRQPLDRLDRKILSTLVEDATQSYAELGRKVGLSAPAVHERVKRLKRTGVIRKIAALIDGEAVDKNLLAFVHVDTSGWGKTPELLAVAEQGEGLTRFWACWALSWLDPSLLTSDMIECLRSEQEQPSTSITPYAAMEAISKVIARELKDGE